jgi:hypothetical protein
MLDCWTDDSLGVLFGELPHTLPDMLPSLGSCQQRQLPNYFINYFKSSMVMAMGLKRSYLS